MPDIPLPSLAQAYPDARPYTRWWWFSGPIDQAHVRSQLDWVRANGFGGVEMAWVYPQPNAQPGARFLSSEWSQAVAQARQYALSLGLGCDLTFGTLWPFGGSFVPAADASRTYLGPSPQRLGRSWELPYARPGRVLNHLDPIALQHYTDHVGAALAPALGGRPAALFCDSWEVEGADLWTAGFGASFRQRFGYDIEPWMRDLDSSPGPRYDYRCHLADSVLQAFYRPLATACHSLGALARVQCHGSPTDLLAAYAAADVPESEAVLFDPPFSRLAASAAALAGRPLVSAEAFTCLYGWTPYPGPGLHQGEERLADLRLCADALLANGVNFLVWHGMPYSPPGVDQRFYASVHVGPGAAFASQLGSFNAYIARVCAQMRRGRPLFRLGAYLPLEDAWMRGALPPALRRPSANHYWELQTERLPRETEPYLPVWVTAPFLSEARYEDGGLHCGELTLDALHVDAAWLDRKALEDILRLAASGLPVCMKRRPAQPGLREDRTYQPVLDRLLALPSVTARLRQLELDPPFLSCLDGQLLPEHCARRHDDGITLFLAHPASRKVTYPMPYGLGDRAAAETRRVELRLPAVGRSRDPLVLELEFPPLGSLLVHVDRHGRAEVESLPQDQG